MLCFWNTSGITACLFRACQMLMSFLPLSMISGLKRVLPSFWVSTQLYNETFCCFEKNVLTSVLSCYALCGLCAELQIEREAVGVIWVMFCLLILFFHHWQEPKRSQHTICDWSVAMCWTCANIRPDQEGRYGVITVILTGGKLRIA